MTSGHGLTAAVTSALWAMAFSCFSISEDKEIHLGIVVFSLIVGAFTLAALTFVLAWLAKRFEIRRK